MRENIPYRWIDTSAQLKEICEAARQLPVVALDTEFIRIRTYYPKLGLIQLFDGQQVSLIDPLAIDDFQPLVALLTDENVIKVFHACQEDIEVLQHYFHVCPRPLLDTQTMAAFVGFGLSVGFAKLVAHYCDIELDKTSARTDWLARPLSEQQCQYACADVFYLLPIFQQLQAVLANTPWKNAVVEECELQCRKRLQPQDPNKAYRDIGNAWQLTPPQLAVLQVLAKWRIEEAQKRDLALNFVIKEQSLLEIAKIQPKHTASLQEFMHPNEVRIHGKKLLWLVEQGKAMLPENYPAPIERLIEQPCYKQTLKKLQQSLIEVTPEGLSSELLASKRQLNQLIKWINRLETNHSPNQPELLQGWRTTYGEALLARLQAV